MTNHERINQLHEEAIQKLLNAHKERKDEPLILAIRYRLGDPQDIYLLEVLKDFPGGSDDELLSTAFERSAELFILGKLHIVLGSPAQLESAIQRGDVIIDEIKNGKVIFDDTSEEAQSLKSALGL
jgi:hypothetical protein